MDKIHVVWYTCIFAIDAVHKFLFIDVEEFSNITDMIYYHIVKFQSAHPPRFWLCSYAATCWGDDPTRQARSVSIKDVGWVLTKWMFIAMGMLKDCRQTAMLQLHGRDDDVMPSAGWVRARPHEKVSNRQVNFNSFYGLWALLTVKMWVNNVWKAMSLSDWDTQMMTRQWHGDLLWPCG